MVFTTLAKQLTNTSPEPRYCICRALTKDNYIGGLGLDYWWNHLVPQSLSRLMNISIKLLVCVVHLCGSKVNLQVAQKDNR